MEIICRPIRKEESADAALLEKNCLHTPWTESQIASLRENALYLGAFCNDALAGIISAYFVLDECQIMNLAVNKEHRNQGIAMKLMNGIMHKAEELNCKILTLEVAEDNFPAIRLYEKCGFLPVGKRKNFYGSTSAVLMEKNL